MAVYLTTATSVAEAPDLKIAPVSDSKAPVGRVYAVLGSDYLEDLAMCESSNNPLAVNWHDHGSPSYGLLQFKEATFKSKVRQYNLLPEAEDSEIMNWIYDGQFQLKLARLILEEKNGWRAWTNCMDKI